ncbi:MAG: sulfatase [Verrucomicrobiales bacterium]|nr:sulfatase [Verrucomicrobiales bacterium]
MNQLSRWTLRFTMGLTLIISAQICAAGSKNILLIIADDYGADSSSLYNSTNNGASLPPTPNIVALAQSGVTFRNAYANPVCSPTRACLITGRYGFRTGVGDVVMGPGTAVLSASEFTLPDAFAANPALGYQLASFGKWHLATGPSTPSTVGGWPYFAGSIAGEITSYTNWSKVVNGSSTTRTNYATTDLVDDAAAWIQSKGTNPWFAWVAFNAPHVPLHKPPTNLCPHYTTLSGTTPDINANPRKYFEAMTEAMDTEIGRLLTSVNLTNTHVIFLGDNGTLGNVIQPPFTSTRAKGVVYEGGVRVPFVVAGPAVVSPGRTNDTPVHVVDVFSTILEMAGINVAATIPSSTTIDSQSFLPILTNTATLSRYVYVEKFGTNTPTPNAHALRGAQFKLIQFTNSTEEFYDLASDPYEATNLLSGTLSATQKANYYSLQLGLGHYSTLSQPVMTNTVKTSSLFSGTVQQNTSLFYSLWRSSDLGGLTWAPVTNALIVSNGVATITLTDTNASGAQSFYRVLAKTP